MSLWFFTGGQVSRGLSFSATKGQSCCDFKKNPQIASMVDQQIISSIKVYVNLLNREGFDISRVFLFGSFARGEANDTSDIDLMLLSESLNDDDVQKKGRAWVLTRQVDSRIEPLLVSKKRFQSDEGSPILEIVRKEGLELRI